MTIEKNIQNNQLEKPEKAEEEEMENIIISLLLFLVFIVAILYATIFKVPASHLGLPVSIFTERYKRALDSKGNQVPIHNSYREGFHLKRPWWRIILVKREVITRKIENKEYQTGGVDGGTVQIAGMIQYRPSRRALFRILDVDENSIREGMDSEIDNFLGNKIGTMDLESVITMKKSLSKDLFDQLTREWEDPSGEKRFLDGKPLKHSEVSYGIEVLKANIDTVTLPVEVKTAREKQKKEQYEKVSQTTEWTHLMEKIQMLKTVLPNLEEKEALRAIQVWQKQFPFEAKELKIDSPDALSSLLGVLSGFTKNNGGTNP